MSKGTCYSYNSKIKYFIKLSNYLQLAEIAIASGQGEENEKVRKDAL